MQYNVMNYNDVRNAKMRESTKCNVKKCKSTQYNAMPCKAEQGNRAIFCNGWTCTVYIALYGQMHSFKYATDGNDILGENTLYL